MNAAAMPEEDKKVETADDILHLLKKHKGQILGTQLAQGGAYTQHRAFKHRDQIQGLSDAVKKVHSSELTHAKMLEQLEQYKQVCQDAQSDRLAKVGPRVGTVMSRIPASAGIGPSALHAIGIHNPKAADRALHYKNFIHEPRRVLFNEMLTGYQGSGHPLHPRQQHLNPATVERVLQEASEGKKTMSELQAPLIQESKGPGQMEWLEWRHNTLMPPKDNPAKTSLSSYATVSNNTGLVGGGVGLVGQGMLFNDVTQDR